MLGGADNPNGELLSYIIGADNLWISQIFSGEPGMYILRRDMPVMIVSFQGWSGDHAVCSLLSPE